MPKEHTLLEEYINKIDEACGEGKEFIITLKYDKREEALKRVLNKCHLGQTIVGILTKGKYLDKDISIFRTGRLVIRQFNGREEAENFLEELLR
ncbi:MAG: hypothetical protein V1850_07050 [Candidatus Bathyarchaeota archaeon]